ncbi:MAG: caspase family protein [Burkholderiales bacterium]|nr:caspase family protein [Burkholderiales bacterium]
MRAVPAVPEEPAEVRVEAEARRARIAAALAAPPLKPIGEAAQTKNETPAAPPAAKEQRLALVIGNSSYKQSPLINPANDARAMTIKLQQLGFTVLKKENADLEEMIAAVREFGNQLKNGGVGLFYFAGHGVQSKGINYLIPINANIRHEDELATRAYNANELLEKMDTAKNRINMVILDACRDNPFARSFRSSARGLAGIEQAPTGTLVAYATSPGATAADGSGSNGLYTEQLLRAMSEPGLKMEDVFKRVRVSVMERSSGKQVPWEMSSVVGDFYFNPTSVQLTQMASLPASTAASSQPQLQRELLPVLIPRKLIDNYQLVTSMPVQSPIVAAQFSSSGHSLAVAYRDKSLKVLDTHTGNVIATETHFGEVTVTADKRYVIGLTDTGSLTILDMHSDAARKAFTGLPVDITAMAMSPNGKRLLIHTRGNGFALFNLDSGKWMGEAESADGTPMFAFSPSGDRLVTWGGNESNLKLWAPDKGTQIKKMRAHWHAVGFAKFNKDGSLLLTVAHDDAAIMWRTSDGEDLHKFSFGDNSPVPAQVEFLNDGKHVLAYAAKSAKTANSPMQLGIWEVASGTPIVTFMADGSPARSIRLSRDLERMFVISPDKTTHVFNLAAKKRINTLNGMELLDFSPDGRRFLVKSSEGLRLMDMQTMAPLGRMPGQVHAFLPRSPGNPFATSGSDGTLTLWNFDNGEAVNNQLKGHLDAIASATFSADGRRLFSVGSDNFAKLWGIPDIKDGKQLVKDQFESTVEYQKRLANWSSPYSTVADLAAYNADTETYTVKISDASIAIPLPRDAAKKLVGQRQAVVTGVLKFFDAEQLVLTDFNLARLP